MKKICFIGAFEKLDLILYISKIMKSLGKKVLIVDATQLQKARYIVPTITPTKYYVTTFDDIDIAIGFNSFETIEKYVSFTEERKMEYDYVFIDADDAEVFGNFNNIENAKNYFVTSFDLYSIKKGLETIRKIEKPIKITKLIFSNQLIQEDIFYLEYLALGCKVIWEDSIINFPYETQNLEAGFDGQKNSKIKIKGLTQLYKENLEYLITDIMPDVNIVNLKRVIKNIEKDG